MAEEASRLYPWRRANLEEHNIFTLGLIEQEAQEHYIELIDEIGAAACALNEIYGLIPAAQARQAAAYNARDKFCKDQHAFD